MSHQVDPEAIQKLLREMERMRSELAQIRNQSLTESTRGATRRRIRPWTIAALAASALAIAYLIDPAHAKLLINNGGAGAIVMPAGNTPTGTLPANTVYGLIGSPDSSLNLGGFSAGYKAGVLGITNFGVSSNVFGVFGNGGEAGVLGSSSNYGVKGIGFRGVYGLNAGGSNGSGLYGAGGGNGVGVIGSDSSLGGLFIGTSQGVEIITGGATSSFDLPGNTSVGLIANAGYPLNLSTFGDDQNIGLYAIANSAGGRTGTAGVFSGNLAVYGTLTKGGGSFKIDHPLEPASKFLYHSFVESPDMKNIYDGVTVLDANGEAVVELPKWFEALNSDCRYQLTPIGTSAPGLFIAKEIAGGRFTIAGGQAEQKVSWQVTGTRQDAWAKANRIPVEQEKSESEKGFYLYPQAHGLGCDKCIDGGMRSPAAQDRAKPHKFADPVTDQ